MKQMHRILALACLQMGLAAALAAQTLDTQGAREVLRAGTWDAADFGGYDRYWEWREDSTVCLRLFDEDAETCDDSGSWTLENGRVCFRMQWWGLADQSTSGCFRIVRTKGDGYQAIDDKGVLLFDFTIESEE